jgi:hypothetical protein
MRLFPMRLWLWLLSFIRPVRVPPPRHTILGRASAILDDLRDGGYKPVCVVVVVIQENGSNLLSHAVERRFASQTSSLLTDAAVHLNDVAELIGGS